MLHSALMDYKTSTLYASNVCSRYRPLSVSLSQFYIIVHYRDTLVYAHQVSSHKPYWLACTNQNTCSCQPHDLLVFPHICTWLVQTVIMNFAENPVKPAMHPTLGNLAPKARFHRTLNIKMKLFAEIGVHSGHYVNQLLYPGLVCVYLPKTPHACAFESGLRVGVSPGSSKSMPIL